MVALVFLLGKGHSTCSKPSSSLIPAEKLEFGPQRGKGPLEVVATWLLTKFSGSVHCHVGGLKSNQAIGNNHSDIPDHKLRAHHMSSIGFLFIT